MATTQLSLAPKTIKYLMFVFNLFFVVSKTAGDQLSPTVSRPFWNVELAWTRAFRLRSASYRTAVSTRFSAILDDYGRQAFVKTVYLTKA